MVIGVNNGLSSFRSSNGNGTCSKSGKDSTYNRVTGNSVGKNTCGDGVSVGDGVGHNMVGGVDVGSGDTRQSFFKIKKTTTSFGASLEFILLHHQLKLSQFALFPIKLCGFKKSLGLK